MRRRFYIYFNIVVFVFGFTPDGAAAPDFVVFRLPGGTRLLFVERSWDCQLCHGVQPV